jgi:hypothetical protein
MWPDVGGYTETCSLPSRHAGVLHDGRCTSPCPRGFFLYGGTHCVKECRSDVDCGGQKGRMDLCSSDDGKSFFCGGLCPTESCPYRYY